MNHLEAAFSGKNNFWRYIVMIAAVFLAANTIGAIPLLVAMAIKTASQPELLSEIAANPNAIGLLAGNPLSGLALMLFPFVAGLIAFILLIRPLNNRSFSETVNGTGGIRWNRIFISALVWIIISLVYLFVYMKIDPVNFSINNTSSSIWLLLLISLILIPFQTTFEEILFRGYIMQGIAVLTRTRLVPVLATSLFFGLLHAWNPEVKEYGFVTMMPQYILFGLLFGITTIFDDGIEIAIGAHTANNFFLSVMVTNSSSALQTPALYEQENIYPWIEFWSLAAASVIFFTAMWMIFRWGKTRIPWRVSAKPAVDQML
jgi:membrane protease YdiL (CAAX protease family)